MSIYESLISLERRWREDASGGEGYNYTAYEEGRIAEKRKCADDLRTILDGCAGDVEAVAIYNGLSVGSKKAALITDDTIEIGTKLYTHPPAVETLQQQLAAVKAESLSLHDRLDVCISAIDKAWLDRDELSRRLETEQQQLAAAREALQAAEAERDSWHHSADTDLMKWRAAEETLRRLQSQEGVMALAATLRQARHYVKHAVAHAPFAGNNPEVPMAVLNNVDAAISWLDYSEITAATLQRDRQP